MPSDLAASLCFRPFTADDVPDLAKVVNNAFAMYDYFKRPEYYDRTSEMLLMSQVATQHVQACIVGGLPAVDPTSRLGIACAALVTHYLKWRLHFTSADGTTKIIHTSAITLDEAHEALANAVLCDESYTLTGIAVEYHPAISTVSVHDAFQRKGLGKVLVAKCEEYCRAFTSSEAVRSAIASAAKEVSALDVTIDTKVVCHLEVLASVNPGLAAFYTSMGFALVGEQPFSGNYICLPEYTFTSLLMEKALFSTALCHNAGEGLPEVHHGPSLVVANDMRLVTA